LFSPTNLRKGRKTKVEIKNKNMQETFKKLSEEIKSGISAQLQTKEAQDFIAATKAAEDSGSFEVVISTADVDRDGESIDQKGWDFTFYKMNPVVLWAHDYSSLPIGMCEDVRVEGDKTIARGKFAPESANPFAQQVRRLYDLKIIQATSVGFIVREANGATITRSELLEFSFVPVPANPYALSSQRAHELGLNVEMLIVKGFKIEEEKAAPSEVPPQDLPPVTPQEGDACKMPDGSPGVYETDDSGQLVCVPKVEAKPKSAAAVKDELMRHEEEIKTAVVAHTQKILEAIGSDNGGEKESKIIADKAGRVLSEKNRSLIKSAIDQFKSSIAALEELLQATEPQGVEGEEGPQDGGAPKQRSNGAGFGEKEALDAFLSGRQVLRLVNNVTSEALRKLNERPRPKTHGSKRS
jgi:hypothetical protein